MIIIGSTILVGWDRALQRGITPPPHPPPPWTCWACALRWKDATEKRGASIVSPRRKTWELSHQTDDKTKDKCCTRTLLSYCTSSSFRQLEEEWGYSPWSWDVYDLVVQSHWWTSGLLSLFPLSHWASDKSFLHPPVFVDNKGETGALSLGDAHGQQASSQERGMAPSLGLTKGHKPS